MVTPGLVALVTRGEKRLMLTLKFVVRVLDVSSCFACTTVVLELSCASKYTSARGGRGSTSVVAVQPKLKPINAQNALISAWSVALLRSQLVVSFIRQEF